ncbi:ATP-binding protein [Porticoccus sp. GXU_MW_L64]
MKRQFLSLYLWLISGFLLVFIASDILIEKLHGNVEYDMFQSRLESYRELAVNQHPNDPDSQLATMRHLTASNGAQISVLDLPITEVLYPEEQQRLHKHGIVAIDEQDEAAVFQLGNSSTIYELSYPENSDFFQYIDSVSLIDMVFTLLFFALISGIWTHRLHSKLATLEKATIDLSEGKLDSRAPTGKKWELGSLNRNFNHMSGRIQTLIQSHKQLTNAVAHELRSPIFRLQCQLDMLAENDATKEQQRFINGIHEDLQELDKLIEEILSYARMERAELPSNIQAHALGPWLQELVDYVQTESPLTITCSPPKEALTLAFDSHLLQRALLNLTRNAIRHANNIVAINVDVGTSTVSIRVQDDGPGVPSDQYDNVFKPFYRLDSARNRDSGGHGLGLAIVREIVNLHKGSVSISTSSMGGACFTISLPLSLQVTQRGDPESV